MHPQPQNEEKDATVVAPESLHLYTHFAILPLISYLFLAGYCTFSPSQLPLSPLLSSSPASRKRDSSIFLPPSSIPNQDRTDEGGGSSYHRTPLLCYKLPEAPPREREA